VIVLADREGARAVFRTRIQEYQDLLERINVSEFSEKEINLTMKEKIIQVAETLPADATIEEAMERLLFLAKVEKGLQQADNGETVSHMEVRDRMSKWLK